MSTFSTDALEAALATRKAPPCLFVLFGATGDLAAKKIAPALYNMAHDGLLDDRTAVLGVARRERSDEQFRQEMRAAVDKYSRRPVDEKLWQAFEGRWHYHVTHANDEHEFQQLARRLAELDESHGIGGSRLFYLAMTPETFEPVIQNLGKTGLSRPRSPEAFVRLVVEKPFGHDLPSARRLNELILGSFNEEQVFRIDHYLGKETVQNILVLRLANAIFEPLLNRQFVDHVQISVTETAGMEGRRGAYYETAGALRDMVQNHLLQLLALVAMEPPAGLDAQSIRDEKLKVLRALRPMTPQEVARNTVRGQYTTGKECCDYRREEGVEPGSMTETFVALRTYVDNWRWSSVPFYLRTGKRLARKCSQITVVFRREPRNLFDSSCDLRGPNRLTLRIHPDEGVLLTLDAKVPGPRPLLRPVNLQFRYDSAFQSASPEAYEHLLLDAMLGEPTLFIRNDEVEASWRFVDSIRAAWQTSGEPPLEFYEASGNGPLQAKTLFSDVYQGWHDCQESVE